MRVLHFIPAASVAITSCVPGAGLSLSLMIRENINNHSSDQQVLRIFAEQTTHYHLLKFCKQMSQLQCGESSLLF